jgi:hypothetical protein
MDLSLWRVKLATNSLTQLRVATVKIEALESQADPASVLSLQEDPRT